MRVLMIPLLVLGSLLAPGAASAAPPAAGERFVVCTYPGRIDAGATLPTAERAVVIEIVGSPFEALFSEIPFVIYDDDALETVVLTGPTDAPASDDAPIDLCASGTPLPTVPAAQIARSGIVACTYPRGSTIDNLGTPNAELEVANLFEILSLDTGFDGTFPRFIAIDDPESEFGAAVLLRYLSPFEEELTDTCPTGSLVPPPVVTPPVVTPPATPVAAKAPVAALPEVGAADPTPGILGGLLVFAGTAVLALRRRLD